jgi:hypothetical protein
MVVVSRGGDGRDLIVTARDMTMREKHRFRERGR